MSTRCTVDILVGGNTHALEVIAKEKERTELEQKGENKEKEKDIKQENVSAS